MIILVSLMILSLLLGILIPNIDSNPNNKKCYLLITFILCSLVSALRAGSVGIDTKSYIYLFNKIRKLGLGDSLSYIPIEKGYIVFNYLIDAVHGNAQCLLAVVSLLISLAFAIYIYRYSENVVVSTFLYIVIIFSSTMNISRQYLAVVLIIFALEYLFMKKMLPTLILILVASLLHTSALIFLPISIFALPKVRIGKKQVIWGSILAIILIMFLNYALFVFFDIFPQYLYLIKTVYFTRAEELSLSLLASYLLVAFSSLVVINRDRDTETESFYLNTLLFYAFIGCYIASSYFWIASRLSPYFQISFLVVLPGYINRLYAGNPRTKVFVYMILISLFFYYGWKCFASDSHGLLPYSFFWQ